MTAQQQIKQALKTIMNDGEANACQVYKGYNVSTHLTGWHFSRFGYSEATYLGTSLDEALETIDRIAGEQDTIRRDMERAGW